MWHWRLSELFKDLFTLSKRQQFFIQLCLFVFLAHVLFVVLISLLSYSLHRHEHFTISSKPKSALYVLSPLQKHVEQKQHDTKQHKKILSSSKLIDEHTYLQELKKEKSVSTLQKTIEQQPVLEISEAENMIEKIASKKAEVSKNQVHKIKKLKSPLMLQDKKTIETETTIKEQQVVKSEIEKKIEQDLQKTDLDVDSVTFVGYQDLDHVMLQERITQSVQQHFKAPIGMDHDVSVELRVYISDQGKVNKIDMIRSSGIVVFDVAARAALYKTILPREVWNKTVTIVLGQ